MKIKFIPVQICLLCIALLPFVAQAQFTFTNNGNNTLTITGYTGTDSTVVIPDMINGYDVTSIGSGAFSSTAIKTVGIPNGVINIGAEAFAYCFSLTNINVLAGNPAFSSLNGVLFNFNETTLIEFPDGLSGTVFRPKGYSLPNGVIHIGDGAFVNCYLTNITIPNSVTSIGNKAFEKCVKLMNLVLPDTVTNIGSDAFAETEITNLVIPSSVITFGWFGFCPDLHCVYFEGNAPQLPPGIPETILLSDTTIYYLSNMTGWGDEFRGYPTILWQPAMQTAGSFSTQTNHFGFNINWAKGQTVVVEVCTNLSNPDWQPVQTNILASGSAYFSDSQWTNYPGRFYRLRSP